MLYQHHSSTGLRCPDWGHCQQIVKVSADPPDLTAELPVTSKSTVSAKTHQGRERERENTQDRERHSERGGERERERDTQ